MERRLYRTISSPDPPIPLSRGRKNEEKLVTSMFLGLRLSLANSLLFLFSNIFTIYYLTKWFGNRTYRI